MEGILIACIDGLNGFPEAVEAIVLKTRVQLCIVHQIRSSMCYVPEKRKKAVMADMKPIYQAIMNTRALKGCWSSKKNGQKISTELQVLADTWVNLSAFFEYDARDPQDYLCQIRLRVPTARSVK